MSNLFICYTPLQTLIATRIIEHWQLARSECSLLFFSDFDNPKMRMYFSRLGSLCRESHFEALNRRPLLGDLLHVKRLMAGRRFQSVFLANTNQPCTQIALSTLNFENLYTFDDGTSNLSPTGTFTRPVGMGVRRFLITLLAGNRYPQARIRRLAQRHFTVFGGMQNNSLAPLEPISLVTVNKETPASSECVLVLGTVLRELTGYVDSPIAERLSRFAGTLPGEAWYLPHPRGEPIPALETRALHSEKVAEEIIIDLLGRYSRVNLYGFGSATQLMFISEPRVCNHLLRSPSMRPALRALVEDTAQRYGLECIDL